MPRLRFLKGRNNTTNLTCDQIEKFMEDEKGARREYKKLGLFEMSNDERDHFKILQKAGIKKNCANVPKSSPSDL